MTDKEFDKLYPRKTVLLYKDGTECLLECFLCNTGSDYDGYWLMVTKNLQKTDFSHLDPSNMRPDEFQGCSEDFEVIDFGYEVKEQ